MISLAEVATFFINNCFGNRPSWDGVLLTGHLTPATAAIMPGASLVFEQAELAVVEVKPLHFETFVLTIDQASIDQLNVQGIRLYDLVGKEAIIKPSEGNIGS